MNALKDFLLSFVIFTLAFGALAWVGVARYPAQLKYEYEQCKQWQKQGHSVQCNPEDFGISQN